MSAASPATGAAFGDVYNSHTPPDPAVSVPTSNTTTTTTTTTLAAAVSDQEIRESAVGLQRLTIIGPEDTVVARPLNKVVPIPMPKLEGNTRRRPLRFTELPVDVLKDIIKEVSGCYYLSTRLFAC